MEWWDGVLGMTSYPLVHKTCKVAFISSYIAYPPNLRESLLKAQDTIPICPTQIRHCFPCMLSSVSPSNSEQVALGALKAGKSWVEQKLPSVCNMQNFDIMWWMLTNKFAGKNRDLIRRALKPLKVVGGQAGQVTPNRKALRNFVRSGSYLSPCETSE